MDHLLRTKEEVEDPPVTEQIPEHYRRRLAEIKQKTRDIQEQKRQNVDQMMDRDLDPELHDALLDNLSLLLQLERGLNELKLMYLCLIEHNIIKYAD
jgi:hypothetical protein